MPDNENEKVTITFSGYDDTPDNTIMFDGPLNIWKTIDDVNNLYLLDVSEFEVGTPVVVFVRNVNKKDITKPLRGEIGYRGSFFKYEWETNNWQQIALGNHSHANLEILNQIGEIDTSSLKPGEKKVITLEKTDPDNEGNIRTVDYRVAFEDQKELPDVPVDARGKELYLTTDADGNFQWKNSFLPAQTFKLIKFIVNSDFIIQDNSVSTTSYKSIILTKDYLKNNEIIFNPDLHDELLVFDSTGFVPTIKYELTDLGLILYIDENDHHTFDLNENITILIIRDGISGIIDTIENQYMTKKDAIEILSDGTIHLNQYVTKQELEKYASKISHTHSQYIRKDDYDIFDFRYADYQHTHSQYVTQEQVLGIIADIIDGDGNIDPNTIFQEIIKTIDDKLADFDNRFYSKNQVLSLINSAKDAVSNSDAIKVTLDGRTLTDYLKYLDEKKMEVGSVYDNKIMLSDVEVQVGNTGMGGYESGDLISKGTTLTQFIRKLVQKEIPPELKEPEIKFDYTISSTDVGDIANFKITPHFMQNNAGRLINLKLFIYPSKIKSENIIEILLNNHEPFGTKINLEPYNELGDCCTIELVAEFDDGDIYRNNLNNGKTYQIKGGSKHEYINIKCNRKAYIGSLPIDITYDTLTGDTIHQYAYSAFKNPLGIININQDKIDNGLMLRFNQDTDTKTIILAIPDSSKTYIKKIDFLNQNYDILDDFATKNISIPDVSNNYNSNVNNGYKVYFLVLPNKVQSDMTFKVDFICTKEEGE